MNNHNVVYWISISILIALGVTLATMPDIDSTQPVEELYEQNQ